MILSNENVSDFILDFFRRKNEVEFNKHIGDSDYNTEPVIEYINDICSISIEEYLYFIEERYHNVPIGTEDVVQFSRIENATDNLCRSLQENGCLPARELGHILLKREKLRGENAYERYGYDHCRLADALGLVIYQNKEYSLSALGRAYTIIDPEQRNKLLTRLIIRTKLITRLYKEYSMHKNDDTLIEVEPILYCLSHSTYIRRCPNIRGLFKVLLLSDEYSFIPFFQKLKF